MLPELHAVEALLERVARRLDSRAAAEGAAIGLAAAALSALLGWPSSPIGAATVGVGAGVVGTILRVLLSRSKNGSIPLFVERHVPRSRNVIVTAHELSADAAPSYVRALVLRRAADVAGAVDVGSLVPVRRATVALAATLAVWLFAVTHAGAPILASRVGAFAAGNSVPTLDGVELLVTPPSYANRPAQTLRDPSRVEALVGSRITIKARAHATSVLLETLTARDSLAPSADGQFASSVVATSDGYLSLEPRAGSRIGSRRLVGLTVMPDAAPSVTIKTPGRDVRLADGHRSLDVAIEANDDIGLASLRLHYTKVSGSGERFTFAEGDVPITVTRTDARAWTAHVTWRLDPLELGPGDMVVYRAIAADQRPNATPSESDSYIAEVASVGGEAAAGFAVDPEQDRYAVSQQMVILKTERLLARRATMATEDYRNEAQQLAAEQRKVRAEFVFMLGGELADAPDVAASMTELNEENEAEGEADILAGRNANAGHVALLRAIRAMSRAATSLSVAELDPALPQERSALTQLESAFSHTRILLRALSTRERLDLSRRLTGVLTDAVREQHPAPQPSVDQRTTDLRRILADIASIAAVARFDDSASAQLSLIAERVLRVDATAKPMQDVAQQLSDAARELERGRTSAAHTLLDRAATGVATLLRSGVAEAPRIDRPIEAAQLGGALRDAQRTRARP